MTSEFALNASRRSVLRAAANERLGALGYQARSEGAELILSAREAQP